MENNRRYNRERDDYRNRDRDSHHYRRVEEDMYRGAYRFDNDSDHSNETTYDGFDLNDSMARHHEPDNYRAENNQGGDYVYRRSRNTEDNERRYSAEYRRDMGHNSRQRQDDVSQRYYEDRYGNGSSNFNNSYAPDAYRNRHPDQNYGNMSGSLSFGYDGDYNSDPDYRRRYDPMSGNIRQDRDEDRRNRHPRHYGPPDPSGMNPDYDRY